MDDSGLDPSAFFSPSKARQQRAQAQDWQQVDSWLAKIYHGRTIPSFERNEDTLKALLALATANERADEEAELVEELQQEALKEIENDSSNPDVEVYDTITDALTPEAHGNLDALSRAAVVLDVPRAHPESIASALIPHTHTQSTLSIHLATLQHLASTLETTLETLHAHLSALQSSAFAPPSALANQTVDWTRKTKALRAKLREYEDRLATLSPDYRGPASPSKGGGKRGSKQPTVTIGGLVEREAEVKGLIERVGDLERRVGAFKGLPDRKEEARKEVEKARRRLEELRAERDRLFEELVE
ncbi:hypothetical protein BDY21DRAFT_191535 [Lineolata rhizophorae]|uniref:HAUS augmin-like complex subunit 1 n=1 Tax=Lineolata rhizophorae TaxID=578093 RepID=A0A6A6P674_9PEZI|nr:hypothetical protein BDY21DRAFT_191535 [Lineolata rhizophorae]